MWAPHDFGILRWLGCYLLYIYISSHSSTTATVSSWVHLILSSNLSRKFKTLLQDLFSWHPATSTQHLSWKNWFSFPLQNIWNIKSLLCVSVLWMVLVLLTFLNCSVSYTTLFFWHPHAENPARQTQESWLLCFLLLWTPHLEFTPIIRPLLLNSVIFKAKLKAFLFSQYFHTN